MRAGGVLKNWIDAGELRAARVGHRRVRVRQSDLDKFLDASIPSKAEAQDADTPNPPPADEPLSSDAGHLEAVDTEQFARALTRTLHVAIDEDPAEIASALRAVASAADRLAEALEKLRGAGER